MMTKKHGNILLILIFVIILSMAGCSDRQNTMNEHSSDSVYRETDNGQAQDTETANEAETGTDTKIIFPYELDNGNLLINSLFQSCIENPDYKNEYADDIASLEVINQSGKFLESAEITLHMNDGMKLHMLISDIPANQKVWVFDNKNNSITSDTSCISIDCKANYLDQTPLMTDQIAVDIKETSVTLTNQSEIPLEKLTVKCHCLFDGGYYGGLTYNYPIEELSPGESTVIEADDCFLGTADVVRISK